MRLPRYARSILQKRRGERYSEKYSFFKVEKPGYLVLTAERIEMQDAKALKQELSDYINRYVGDITLDVSSLAELDSSGVATLVCIERMERNRGNYLRVTGLKGRAKSELQILKLERLLTEPEKCSANQDISKARQPQPR